LIKFQFQSITICFIITAKNQSIKCSISCFQFFFGSQLLGWLRPA